VRDVWLFTVINTLSEENNAFVFAVGMMCMAGSIVRRNTHYYIMSQQFVCTVSVFIRQPLKYKELIN